MQIIPTGVPAWLRQNNFASYGGHLEKKNFASRGAINPKTDVSAEAFSRIAADLAAVALVAPFGVFTILCDDSTPGPPTVEYASMMTGTRSSSYLGNAPPTGFPSVARNGNGDFTMTFAATYTDPYGVAGALELKNPKPTLVGSTPGSAQAEILTATTLRVRAFVLAGTALSNARVSLNVGSGA